jgi:hypothetical protein
MSTVGKNLLQQRVRRASYLLSILVLISFSTACGSGGQGQTGLPFVFNTLKAPDNAGEVTAYSFDLDGDSGLDNKLGSTLLGFNAGLDFQAALNAALVGGQLIQLVHLDAASVADSADVPTVVCTGTDGDLPPNASNNFSGSGAFDVEPASVGAVPLSGTITAGDLTAGPGSISLLFTAGSGAPVTLHLVGGRVRAALSESLMIDGTVGGGIPESEVSALLIPAIHEAILEAVTRDCAGGTCTSGSAGEAFMNQYDDDDDNSITLDEFQNDAAVQVMFASDLDLLDGAQFAPNVDGFSDSLSFGIGFTAVRALFELP